MSAEKQAIHQLIAAHAGGLSERLRAHRLQLFPPSANKTLRTFTSGEAARLIGVNDGYLRHLSLENKGPQPETGPGGRRSYTIGDIQALRSYLDSSGKADRRYLPHRSGSEHLQVLAIVNFKGGSGKTTTAAHLAQYLALNGYRVLAIDLDLPSTQVGRLWHFQMRCESAEFTKFDRLRVDFFGIRRDEGDLYLDPRGGRVAARQFIAQNPLHLYVVTRTIDAAFGEDQTIRVTPP